MESLLRHGHRIRNSAAALFLLLLGLTAPLTLTKGNRVVGGNDTLIALWAAAGTALLIWFLATDFVHDHWPLRVHWRGFSPDDSPSPTTDVRVGFNYKDEVLTVTVHNGGRTLSDAILNLVVPKDVPLALVDSGSVAPTATGIHDWNEQPQPQRPLIYWWATGCHLYGHSTSVGLSFRVGKLREAIPVVFKVGGDELGQWVESRGVIGPS